MPVAADSLVAAFARNADNPSAVLALNSGVEYFRAPGIDGFIAFRRAGRHIVQICGPIAPVAEHDALVAAFLSRAAASRYRVMAVQLQRNEAETYQRHGFRVDQIGASYAVDLERFTLRGKQFVSLRNKISRAGRAGISTQIIPDSDLTDRLRAEIRSVDDAWLHGKGAHTHEIAVLVGELGGKAGGSRRVVLARIDGRLIGYLTFSPVAGSRPGWLHDLSRKVPDAPPGTMELMVSAAVDQFRCNGDRWLHFGFTPFTGLSDTHRMRTSHRAVRTIVRLLAEHGEKLYPAATQLAYKQKWAPHEVLPDYVAFQGRPRAAAIWQLVRLTNLV